MCIALVKMLPSGLSLQLYPLTSYDWLKVSAAELARKILHILKLCRDLMEGFWVGHS